MTVRRSRLAVAAALILCLQLVACAALRKAPLRPGSTDVFDSYASGVLEQTAKTIRDFKVECPSGPTSPCPQSKKDAINKVIDVYAEARKAWLPYHDAIVIGQKPPQAALAAALSRMTEAVTRGVQ